MCMTNINKTKNNILYLQKMTATNLEALILGLES